MTKVRRLSGILLILVVLSTSTVFSQRSLAQQTNNPNWPAQPEHQRDDDVQSTSDPFIAQPVQQPGHPPTESDPVTQVQVHVPVQQPSLQPNQLPLQVTQPSNRFARQTNPLTNFAHQFVNDTTAPPTTYTQPVEPSTHMPQVATTSNIPPLATPASILPHAYTAQDLPPIQNPQNWSFIYGYNAMLYHDMEPWQNRKRVLEISKASGVYWIRQQVAWKDLHDESGSISWGELDRIVQDVHSVGMKLLISVVQAPAWATPNGAHGLPDREHFSHFAHFMGQMAARYRGKVQAYEIWNEQNLACQNGGDCTRDNGTGGRVTSADHYVDMLLVAYDAIKANDPDAIVVSGATASTETNHPDYGMSDLTFMREMLTNPKFRADAIGAHPGNHNNPPDTLWPDNPGREPGWQDSREFYFRRIEDVWAVIEECGKSHLPIWVTEFGWATPNTSKGFEYGNQNTFEQQAEWIVQAFEKAHYEYAPNVQAMFLWNLNFSVAWKGAHNDETHEQASFSIINGDWSPRPAWYAIRAMPKQ